MTVLPVLPIDSHLAGIMDLFAHHQVVVVQAETGAGKTTRLPQAALSIFRDIVVTQTRRTAVRWNGRRIAEELGCQPGELVGWRLHNEAPMVSPDTRLTLGMDQSLVNRIRREGRLPEGLIIIDEAHERSVAIDLLLGLVKQYLPSSPNTKVLVTSATIDTEKFSRYFDDAPVVKVAGKVYPVSSSILRMLHGEHHSECAARAAGDVLEDFISGTLEVPTEDGSGVQFVRSGTVIVLLPGKEDIANVMRQINDAATRLEMQDRVQVMACHGESTPEEQDAIQSPVPEGVLRFVCGTVVLRNSVTVRQTVGVIDSLQVKHLIVSPQGAANLAKVTVSKAEADQAKGRAGRTAPGFYIAVSFLEEFEDLDSYPQPAILREPIPHVVLQVAAAGLNVRTFPFLDRPQEDHIEMAIRRLRRVGALDDHENITEMGRLLLQFPIDPERAKALVTGDELGVLAEVVIVAAVLEAEGIFHRPNKPVVKVMMDEPVARLVLSYFKHSDWGDWEYSLTPVQTSEVDLNDLPSWVVRYGNLYELNCGDEGFPVKNGARWVADLIRATWAGESCSDFVAIVRAYREYKAEERRLQKLANQAKSSNLSPKKGPSRESLLRDWCLRHSVNVKRIRMAEQVMREIRVVLANSPLSAVDGLADEREFDASALTKALVTGMADNVAVKDSRGDYCGGIGSFKMSYGTPLKGAALIVVNGIRTIPVARGVGFHVADLGAQVDPAWLVELMPHMCIVSGQEDLRYDPATDQVVETQRIAFGDLEIRVTMPSQNDGAAALVFAEWLANQYNVGEYGTILSDVMLDNADAMEGRRSFINRSGEASVGMTQHYLTALRGARSVAGIVDPEALRLPPLDPAVVTQIMLENPDSIRLLGSDVEVHYSQTTPVVRLGNEAVVSGRWRDLPDSGVVLPSGRVVNVSVSIGMRRIEGTDVPNLKAQVRDCLNQGQFNSWTGRPEISLPVITSESVVIPPIVEIGYGTDALNGQTLLAFGTVSLNPYRFYPSDPHFRGQWFTIQAEAQAAWEEVSRKLEEIKDSLIEEQRLAVLRTRAVELRDRMERLENKYFESLSFELADRLYRHRFVPVSSYASVIEAWMAEAEAIIAEVEASQIKVELPEPSGEEPAGTADLSKLLGAFRPSDQTRRARREPPPPKTGRNGWK